MVATVEDGQVTKLRPDPDHPLSKGYACPKGIAMLDVQNDPDRVTHPLRRVGGPGEFERVTWQEALTDIAARLRAIEGRRVGWYMGNPRRVLVLAHALGHRVPQGAGLGPVLLGRLAGREQPASPRARCSTARRSSSRFPDLKRTKLLLMVGANPLVSHGSVLTAPRIRELLHDIERVVVVDPRRSETAGAFEHLPIRPDTDALLLLSLLNVIFEDGLADEDALRRQSVGAGALRMAARAYAPEETEQRTGVRAETARELARALATTDGAAVYGRHGLVPGAVRHARRLPARRAERRHRQPRRAGRRRLRTGGDRARRDRRACGPRHLRRRAHADRRLPGRHREPAGDADAARDRRRRDPRAVRLGRQPGAVRPRRRRPSRPRSNGWTCACRSTSTSTRPTSTPTTCCPRPRTSSARTCRSPSSASTPRRSCSSPTRWSSPPARRARSGRSSRRCLSAWAWCPARSPRCACCGCASARCGSRTCCCAPARTATGSACAAAG